MKVLIIFFAVLIVFVSSFVFEGDMIHYIRLENELKSLAEECAIGASLYYEEESYGEGNYILNRTEGEAFVTYMVNESQKKLSAYREGNLTYELELYDAEKGFRGTERKPSAVVTVTYQTGDLFRLPFLRVTEITRQGTYEIVN